MFIPDTGPAAGALKPDGSFALQATAGRHRVIINALPRHPEGFDPMAGGVDYVPPEPLVLYEYGQVETSGLSFEVQSNEGNVAHFDLPL